MSNSNDFTVGGRGRGRGRARPIPELVPYRGRGRGLPIPPPVSSLTDIIPRSTLLPIIVPSTIPPFDDSDVSDDSSIYSNISEDTVTLERYFDNLSEPEEGEIRVRRYIQPHEYEAVRAMLPFGTSEESSEPSISSSAASIGENSSSSYVSEPELPSSPSLLSVMESTSSAEHLANIKRFLDQINSSTTGSEDEDEGNKTLTG